MVCHGKCDSLYTVGRWGIGTVFCRNCTVFYKSDHVGLRCPCCHAKLRVKPRRGKTQRIIQINNHLRY